MERSSFLCHNFRKSYDFVKIKKHGLGLVIMKRTPSNHKSEVKLPKNSNNEIWLDLTSSRTSRKRDIFHFLLGYFISYDL